MGLRTQSEWQTTPQKMGNVDGMTPKQESMSTARSPLAGQQQNTPKPDKTAQTAQQQEAREVQEQVKEGAATTPQRAQQQQASPVGMAVENAAAKLGNFAHSLRAKVNQFLSTAAQTTGMGESTAQYVWDPEARASTLRVTEGGENLDPVIQEKLKQQEALKGSLSPFAQQVGGKLMGKGFGQVVKEQMGDDPEVTRLVQMVTSLQDMDARGLSGTPEALALESQLKQMDKFGMVSSLRDAMNDYNEMMGLSQNKTTKWYGGDTEGFSVLDIANLGVDRIKSEVEQAKLLSSGLFSGDFEENLQKQFDKESAESQRAARRSEALHSELYSAFKEYSDETSELFRDERDDIDKNMNLASEAVRASMLLTPEGREALQWLDLFGDGESDNVVGQLMSALSDENSGLGVEQREAITQFIGRVGSQSGGQLQIWMESLGKTGKVPITDDTGTTTMVEPSSKQKLEILGLMQSKDMDPVEKKERLQELVKNIGIDQTTNINTSVNKALDIAKKTGNMNMGLAAFTASMAKSMQTFAKSRTEDYVREGLGISLTEWEAMDPDARAAALHDAVSKNPNLVETIKGAIKAKAAADSNNFSASIETQKTAATKSLSQIERQLDPATEGTIANTQLKLQEAPKTLVTNAATDVVGILRGWTGTAAKSYIPQIQSNPWVQQQVASGVVDRTFPADLANLYAVQNALNNIENTYPGITNLVWYSTVYTPRGKRVTALMDKDITAEAMQDPKQIKSMLNAVTKNMSGLFDASGTPTEALTSNIMKSMGVTYAGDTWSVRPLSKDQLAKLTPAQIAIYTTLTDASQQMKLNGDGLAKLTSKKTEVADGITKLDTMASSLDIPVFNPEDIINEVLGMARGVEDIAGGKLPEGWELDKALSPENLAVLIPKLLAGKKEGEPVDSGIPPQLKTVLEGLGLPIENWSIVGGIPHIRMGDGDYQPVTEDILAKISGELAYEQEPQSVYQAPTIAGVSKNIGKLDTSKLKLPVLPKPKNVTAASKTQQRNIEREYKLPKAPAGFGQITMYKDTPGFFSRLMGQTGDAYVVEMRDTKGKVVNTYRVPYAKLPDGSTVISTDGGKTYGTVATGTDIAAQVSDAAKTMWTHEQLGQSFGGDTPSGAISTGEDVKEMMPTFIQSLSDFGWTPDQIRAYLKGNGWYNPDTEEMVGMATSGETGLTFKHSGGGKTDITKPSLETTGASAVPTRNTSNIA